MNQVKLVIFDLDGTLFRTETIDIVAVNRALVENGFERRRDEEILNVIGLTMDEAMRALVGYISPEVKEKFANDIINYEREEIAASGQLYQGVEELLKNLKADGYTVCICTNGDDEYVMPVLDKFSLKGFFEHIWCRTDGCTKSQAVSILKQKFNAETFVMVGDRIIDFEAAKDNDGVSIGVSYGFGNEEIKTADYIANNTSEVYKIINKIFDCGGK